jgi:hypothetical protein
MHLERWRLQRWQSGGDRQDAGVYPFTMDVDTNALWRESYQGEVLGETLFGILAENEHDPDRRHELEIVTLLESATKGIAESLFDRREMDRGDLETTIAAAKQFAEGAMASKWEDFAGAVLAATGTFLEKYHTLVELASDDEERQIAEAYVAHEEALATWARRAMGAEEGDPLAEILALPHVIAAASVSAREL